MRVLQVVSSFAPAYAYGGPARSSFKISKNLSELGHDITVYTTDAYDEENRYDRSKHSIPLGDLDVHRFRNVSNTLAYAYNLCLAPGMAPALFNNMPDFDIVHIEEFRTPQAAMAAYVATKCDVPYLLQTRGGVPRLLKSRQKRVFDAIAGERMFENASRILATSESESSEYFPVFPKTPSRKVEHVPNGVDLETYGDVPDAGRFREQFGINEDVPIVLFVGRLDEMKGVDVLIEALDSVLDKVPDAQVYAVGPDDGQLSKLQGIVSQRDLEKVVHFPGPLYDENKLAAYRDADLFVLPSKYKYESFGNVVVEAMACQTPVVLTDKCGAAEWIPPEAGRTVACDPSEMSQSIVEILQEPDLRHQMAKNGRELVVEKFNWESIATEIEEIYQDVVRENENLNTESPPGNV